MKPLSRLAKLPSILLLTGALVLCPSCKSSGNQWSFSVSRSVYGSGGSGAHISYPVHCNGNNNGAATALAVLILLPLAIDIIILPVTLTHDLCS
jgi:hypothetical protein